jgi:hypothetical protein
VQRLQLSSVRGGLAAAKPVETCLSGGHGHPPGGKSFTLLRNLRPEATDPDTGERHSDVIMSWVRSEAGKLAMIHGEHNVVMPVCAHSPLVTAL